MGWRLERVSSLKSTIFKDGVAAGEVAILKIDHFQGGGWGRGIFVKSK